MIIILFSTDIVPIKGKATRFIAMP